jgi:hypothetical protein
VTGETVRDAVALVAELRRLEREVERLRVAERAAFEAGCVAMREAAAKRLDKFRVSPAAGSLFADVVRAMTAPLESLPLR